MSRNSPTPLRRRIVDLGLALALAAVAGFIVVQVANPTAVDVAKDPLSVAALEATGLSLDRSGHAAEARVLMEFAGRRSWREPQTRLWLLQHRLQSGDLDDAVDDIDALMRVDGQGRLRDTLFPVLTEIADRPDGRAALAASLARSPWWRAAFVAHLAAHGDGDSPRALLTDLRASRAPPTAEETAAWLARRVVAGDYAGARRDWLVLSPAAGKEAGFATPWDHSPFTWSAVEGIGASVEASGGGAILRVDYDGFSAVSLPRRLLALTPGAYELRWRQKGDDTFNRLSWSVQCAGAPGALTRAAEPEKLGVTWSDAAQTFIVPDQGCEAQWLTLTADPGDRRAPQTTWFSQPIATPSKA